MNFKLNVVVVFVFAQLYYSAPEKLATQRSVGNSQQTKMKSDVSSARGMHRDAIVFPDAKSKDGETLKIKPCPNGQLFCDDGDYPSDLIQRIPKEQFEQFANYFLNETLPELPDNSLTTRIDSTNEMSLCESKVETMHPKKAEALDKETKYIVNVGDYWQGITVEVCKNEKAPCQFHESFPSGYTTVCRQKYITKKMVVFQPNNARELSTADFNFPSCCVCKIITTSLGARLGRS